ncbi:hypothetical protein H257_19321 [Aphanomyces astaci]|uniref:Uncharacterized protein n=1 Tax=Aphanomyces astaci TaxID=112090 RepID=W4FAL1_APHAT|nr:hypothetical protein H257_19321 [Aphanomyces astaci]ETV63748.1 hypothetical protein H257_19321 [Aphanomyces astaci]|eukprot:XP_009846768.1 hypothetical protein H257_19321 [Aphanomyces astaci]
MTPSVVGHAAASHIVGWEAVTVVCGKTAQAEVPGTRVIVNADAAAVSGVKVLPWRSAALQKARVVGHDRCVVEWGKIWRRFARRRALVRPCRIDAVRARH